MSSVSDSLTDLKPCSQISISQHYRQAVQLYVEPELLEVGHRHSQPQKDREREPNLVMQKPRYRQVALMLMVTALCCFSASYYSKSRGIGEFPSRHLSYTLTK